MMPGLLDLPPSGQVMVDVDGRRSAFVTPFAGCLSVYRRSSPLQSGSTYQKETCISPHMPPYVVVWIQFWLLHQETIGSLVYWPVRRHRREHSTDAASDANGASTMQSLTRQALFVASRNEDGSLAGAMLSLAHWDDGWGAL